MKRGEGKGTDREKGEREMAGDRTEGKETQRVREARKKKEGEKGGGKQGEARET